MNITIRFDSEIETPTVNELISSLHQHESVDLFFATPGGYITDMYALLHYLNSRKSDIRVFLDAGSHSIGAAFLTEFQGTVVFTEHFESCFIHRWDGAVYKFRKDDNDDQSEKDQQWTKLWKKYVKKLENIGVCHKKIKRLRKNKPVYLYRRELKKLNFKTPTVRFQ